MTEKKSMAQQWADSFLCGGNTGYLEEQYENYLEDPNSVDASFQALFREMHQAAPEEVGHSAIKAHFRQLAQQPAVATSHSGTDTPFNSKQLEVYRLIQAYRTHGHFAAKLDPLNFQQRANKEKLTLGYYGLSEQDLDEEFEAGNLANLGRTKLRNIVDFLKKVYSQHIGYEYMQLSTAKNVRWIRDRIEIDNFYSQFSKKQKHLILKDLVSADGFERFLGNKYVGQKRFSLEGGDSAIPQLNYIISLGCKAKAEEFVIAMAHRGRLNVLANVIGKPISEMIREFDGLTDEELQAAHEDPWHKLHSGDVKYHLGYSMDVNVEGNSAHLALAFNPSHLESVCPVAEGSVHARQTRRGQNGKAQVIPILLHGDASFCGQGITLETFNMSQTRGYGTGGTIHIVINNQIGFTTSDATDARSTEYCTDVAKMLEAPIFHVNADDPEAVMFITKLAFDYRMTFQQDVVIDLVCYRRHGHQEVDEPTATQPLMYQIIKKHPVPYKLYSDKLIKEGMLTSAELEQMQKAYIATMEAGDSVRDINYKFKTPYIVDWTPYKNQPLRQEINTGVDKDQLIKLANKLEALPEGMKLQPQVGKMMEARKKMTTGELPINWGYAEVLAYATLVTSGVPVRLSGEDCQRGTFAHRHVVLHDYKNGSTYTPLAHLTDDQEQFTVINSLLSELAVLGFEYGYASSDPKTLIIWEAQFGDFANGAQIIIDQFISSGEEKWDRLCGLVMLLPHGYEGMGPEHSSARLERYLQLCANENMQVCVPTTPAQIFHLLRRQMVRPCRKPLIVMSPKSLLRHPLAVSQLDDLTQGQFQLIIPEADDINPKKAKRIVLCSGKVYYDLLEKRRAENLKDVLIVRLEQIYPFPLKDLRGLLEEHSHIKDVIWCQEEPRNQGAWYSMRHNFKASLAEGQILNFAGREPSSSPAVGYAQLHKIQQQTLVEQALGIARG